MQGKWEMGEKREENGTVMRGQWAGNNRGLGGKQEGPVRETQRKYDPQGVGEEEKVGGDMALGDPLVVLNRFGGPGFESRCWSSRDGLLTQCAQWHPVCHRGVVACIVGA